MSPPQGPDTAGRSTSQRGGALVVALLLIFMLSILGVSTMRGSTLERRMASNAIQTSTVFQASESVTEVLLNDAGNLNAAYALQGAPLERTIDLQLGAAMATDGDLRYVGDGAALGYSLGVGGNNFMALRYDARGTAALDSVRAYSSVVQGAYRIVPAP